jgi:hypothetical protein
MRFQGAGTLAILCMLAPVTRAADPAPPSRVDFSVLTPSMDGHYTAGSSDKLQYLPYVGGLAGLNMNSGTKRIRRLIDDAQYDPAPAIVERVIAALADGGYSAVHEPIPRRPAGSPQSLSWSDLPERPGGKLFLDLNIRWICICTGDTYFKHRAAISIGWRLLDPRREVVEPTRTLTYVHAPGWQTYDTSSTRTRDSRPAYPPATVSESCAFSGLREVEENRDQLWDCLAESYGVVAQRLVIDLQRIRPPPAEPARQSATVSP